MQRKARVAESWYQYRGIREGDKKEIQGRHRQGKFQKDNPPTNCRDRFFPKGPEKEEKGRIRPAKLLTKSVKLGSVRLQERRASAEGSVKKLT